MDTDLPGSGLDRSELLDVLRRTMEAAGMDVGADVRELPARVADLRGQAEAQPLRRDPWAEGPEPMAFRGLAPGRSPAPRRARAGLSRRRSPNARRSGMPARPSRDARGAGRALASGAGEGRMTIRTARPAAALPVDPCDVRVIVEQLAGLPCRGTLDDELAAETLPSACRRWPLTLASWRATCTCCASGAVGARRSGRVRIGRTAPVATSASTRSSCSTSTARAVVVCGHRCSVWSRPRTGSGGCKPRIAVWPVDPRRTGAAAGSPLNCRRRRVDRRGRSVDGGPAATAALPCSTLELGATH